MSNNIMEDFSVSPPEGNSAPVYRNDNKHRYFTLEGYEHLNRHIAAIAAGNQEAETELLALLLPWMKRVCRQKILRFSLDERVDEIETRNIVFDAFCVALKRTRQGSIANWSVFSQGIHELLNRRVKRMQRNQLSLWSLDEPDEVSGAPLHENLPSQRYPDGYQCDAMFYRERREFFDRILRPLPDKERKILTLLHGLCDEKEHTYTQVAAQLMINRTTVKRKEQNAIKKLLRRHSKQLLTFLS